MAGYILGTYCDLVRGVVPAQRMRVETWAIPGISGEGVQWLGYGDAKFDLRVVRYGANGVVLAWCQAILDKQGAQGTIVTDLGWTDTLCLITQVGTPEIRTAYPHGLRAEIRVEGYKR